VKQIDLGGVPRDPGWVVGPGTFDLFDKLRQPPNEQLDFPVIYWLSGCRLLGQRRRRTGKQPDRRERLFEAVS